mmetsp:Transcript_75110/g.208901  ORF Transcript_75110/g.208901 Transcript_75110/m.208901 type:complete len:250 (-) Transcript_75110:288-1037(-)
MPGCEGGTEFRRRRSTLCSVALGRGQSRLAMRVAPKVARNEDWHASSVHLVEHYEGDVVRPEDDRAERSQSCERQRHVVTPSRRSSAVAIVQKVCELHEAERERAARTLYEATQQTLLQRLRFPVPRDEHLVPPPRDVGAAGVEAEEPHNRQSVGGAELPSDRGRQVAVETSKNVAAVEDNGSEPRAPRSLRLPTRYTMQRRQRQVPEDRAVDVIEKATENRRHRAYHDVDLPCQRWPMQFAELGGNVL